MEGFWKRRLYRYLVCLFLLFVTGIGEAQIKDTAFIKIFGNTLSPSCGVPACHDGSFEPNFSSIASSFSTLVYHPVVKNNVNFEFRYRVVPFDVSKSVLFERITNCCFVNENDRMPFTVGDTLSTVDIDRIKKWIQEGAKSPDGTSYKKPVYVPIISTDCLILGNDSIILYENVNRLDTLYYQPSIVPDYITSITLKFKVFTEIENAKEDSLKVFLELSETDFQSPPSISYPLTTNGEYWFCTIEKKSLPQNRTLWYKLKVLYQSDRTVFFPGKNTERYKRQNWSFIVL